MAEKYEYWSPYQYVRDNPVLRIDLNGMNDDDFFFTKKGELTAYVNNDKPYRVFIAKDDQLVFNNLKNVTDESMYDQVEMSDKEIKKLMNNNGYKKVKEKEILEVREIITYVSEADGTVREGSHDKITNKILSQESMYIDKTKTLKNIDADYLYNIDRKHEGSYMIETNVEKRTYNYNKRDISENANKVIQFIFQVINAFQ